MVSKKLKKIRTYAILLCMLYRTPRSLTFTLAILFISFSLAGVIAPSLFIAEPLIHSPGFLFPVVGLVLFWGLFLLTMDWLPLQKSFRRVCTGINFSVCVLLFVLSIWAVNLELGILFGCCFKYDPCRSDHLVRKKYFTILTPFQWRLVIFHLVVYLPATLSGNAPILGTEYS